MDPDLQADEGRRAQRRRVAVHPQQRAPARPHVRRPARPDGLGRGRRAAVAVAVQAARSRRHRGAGRRDHRAQRGGHPRPRIRELPAGTYHGQRRARPRRRQPHRHRLRHHRRPRAGEILVDYAGSSGASPYGINVVKNYTHAYTTFAVRSVLNPELPNNHGSLAPIKVEAPVGLDRQRRARRSRARPATSSACSCPTRCCKALAQIKPEQAMAEGSGAVWTMQVVGQPRRRPAVHHGDVHLRRRRRRACPQAGPVGLLVPHRRRRSAGRGRRGLGADPLPAQVAARRQRRRRRSRSAGWVRRSSSASTPPGRGS